MYNAALLLSLQFAHVQSPADAQKGTTVEVAYPFDVARIKKLVLAGVRPDAIVYHKDQPLVVGVAMLGDATLLEFLLEHGASRRDRTGGDLLSAVTSHGTERMTNPRVNPAKTIRVLLKFGSRVDDGPPAHETALWGSVFHNDLPIARILLSLNANPNLVVGGDLSCLQTAAQRRQWTLVNLLLDHKADPNRLTRFDGSAFQMAVWNGNLAVAERMIKQGADVNLQNIDRQNALHIAASAGRPDMVKLLMRYRPDTKALDSYGRTPAQAAIAKGHPGIANLMG